MELPESIWREKRKERVTSGRKERVSLGREFRRNGVSIGRRVNTVQMVVSLEVGAALYLLIPDLCEGNIARQDTYNTHTNTMYH